ncbi:MAG: alpha/beta hydrolase [Gammaproteobacteria bacterium]
MIDWALNRRLVVVAFDLPGHGLSSGKMVSIPDFSHYQNVLAGVMALAKSQVPEPWYAVGQSTGAGVLLDQLLHQAPRSAPGSLLQSVPSDTSASMFALPWKRVALLAPLIRAASWGAVRISWHLLHRFQDRVPRNFGFNSHDQNFMNFLQYEDPLQSRFVSATWVGAMIRWSRRVEAAPCSAFSPLVVQGDADTTVDFDFNLPLLSQKFTEPTIIKLPKARHHLVNESASFRAELFHALGVHMLGDACAINTERGSEVCP